MDLSLWDNAISLSVDYYYRKGTDLIGMRMLPLETGYSSTTVNWASMETKRGSGFDHTEHPHQGFTWFTNLNFGFNDNTVLQETVAENSTTPSREGTRWEPSSLTRQPDWTMKATPYTLQKDGQKLSAKDFFQLNNAGASSLSAEEQRNLLTYMGSTDPKFLADSRIHSNTNA